MQGRSRSDYFQAYPVFTRSSQRFFTRLYCPFPLYYVPSYPAIRPMGNRTTFRPVAGYSIDWLYAATTLTQFFSLFAVVCKIRLKIGICVDGDHTIMVKELGLEPNLGTNCFACLPKHGQCTVNKIIYNVKTLLGTTTLFGQHPSLKELRNSILLLVFYKMDYKKLKWIKRTCVISELQRKE